jgi:hypothetical protein
LKSCIYPYCRIYQKTIYLPNTGVRAGKKWQRIVLELEISGRSKGGIVIKTMCILWGGINS